MDVDDSIKEEVLYEKEPIGKPIVLKKTVLTKKGAQINS